MFYAIHVWGSVEPSLSAAFDTAEARDAEAKVIHAASDEEDGVFWLDLDGEHPRIGAYTGAFFEDDSDLCEVDDCALAATPCECGASHCAAHPHVEANLCRCGAPASDKTAHPGRYITGLPGHAFAPQ